MSQGLGETEALGVGAGAEALGVGDAYGLVVG
jgi:hypothetical protein